jgi:hypothetical protein
MGHLFDSQTRSWKAGTYDVYGNKVERLGADRFRMHWSQPMGPNVHSVSLGDLITVRGSGPHNLTVVNCSRMEIENITIYNAGNFAIWESGGEGGNRYNGVTVKRAIPPEGASRGPLLSSTADAFHSTNVRTGPVLQRCDFEDMGDDGIAIQGTFAFVFESASNKLIVNNSTFRPGDPFRLYNARGQPAGEAVVTSVRPVPEYRGERKSEGVVRKNNAGGPYTEVTLDRRLPARFDDLASNPAASGRGYHLRQNVIRNHRARGMLLKADDGLVEDNTIDGSTMGGIVLSPEFGWNEASYSRNVVIRNNVIRHVAYAPAQLGAVVIATTEKEPASGCGHRHILLDRNRFEGLNGVNLLITSACDVVVRGNRFIGPQHLQVAVGGAAWGEDPAALIFVTLSHRVRFEGNSVSGVGAFGGKPLVATASAAIKGADSGILIESKGSPRGPSRP